MKIYISLYYVVCAASLVCIESASLSREHALWLYQLSVERLFHGFRCHEPVEECVVQFVREVREVIPDVTVWIDSDILFSDEEPEYDEDTTLSWVIHENHQVHTILLDEEGSLERFLMWTT